MHAGYRSGFALFVAATVAACGAPPSASSEGAAAVVADAARCAALRDLPNLTITMAKIVAADADTPSYCYVRGAIPPGIAYHVQLPLAANWNGRFLKYGDGTKDGDLDYADHRLAEGYAVANSNMGHDAGAEPGAWFAFDNRQAEIDFGYRAVHLTANAGKAIVAAYYERPAARSYFEGCSTGGREGLIEAQRFPNDFDGIVAGAPVFRYAELNAGHTWLLQRVFRNNYAGNLAFDADGDGTPESLRKLDVLADAVLARCDANDGIEDGVIDEPLTCDFDPKRDLAGSMCANDVPLRGLPRGVDADACFTTAQLQTIVDFYRGPYDSAGTSILKGRAFGAERGWTEYLPHAGNQMFPEHLYNSRDHAAFLFYENDPGVPVPRANDLTYVPDKTATPPEWAWWEFDIDDLTAGKADLMKSLLNATDPDLERFLTRRDGKLILWHGWNDAGAPPAPTLDYYDEVVATTFGGDQTQARRHARLFMFPGMGHCGGGPGPNTWDPLAPLVAWVENGTAPDSVIARHSTDGRVDDPRKSPKGDNERIVCAYPQVARYSGPTGGQNDSATWTQANFTCR
jgi:feruloyl esterase